MWPYPDRPEHGGGPYRPIRPPSPFRLLLMLILVVLAIWYLSRHAG